MKTRVEKLKNHAKSVSYLLSYRKYGQILPLFSDRFLSSKLTARLSLVLHVFSKLLVVFIIFFTSFIILKQQAKTKRSFGCMTFPPSTAIYVTVKDDYIELACKYSHLSSPLAYTKRFLYSMVSSSLFSIGRQEAIVKE